MQITPIRFAVLLPGKCTEGVRKFWGWKIDRNKEANKFCDILQIVTVRHLERCSFVPPSFLPWFVVFARWKLFRRLPYGHITTHKYLLLHLAMELDCEKGSRIENCSCPSTAGYYKDVSTLNHYFEWDWNWHQCFMKLVLKWRNVCFQNGMIDRNYWLTFSLHGRAFVLNDASRDGVEEIVFVNLGSIKIDNPVRYYP